MMIYKQILDLKLDTKQIIELPLDTRFLHIDNQNDMVCFWYLFNPEMIAKQKFEFLILGTGMESENLDFHHHVGTVLMGSFVWHVFAKAL